VSLILKNVSKTVGGQTHIHPTDLTLEKGTMNVLLGPTSAGKTSLMRLMAGLDVPNTGQVIWNGEDVTGMRVQDRKVAMVYQQFINYPSMTVYDNIASPMKLVGKSKDEIDRAVRETAELMQLTPMLDRKPLELSGGQQQRLVIARAIAVSPEVILMDEPLGALDALTREKMQSLVLKLWKETGKTIILITHSVEEALLLGERLLVMAPRPGRIHREYRLPFADLGVGHDLREVKKHPEFAERREEILGMIWDMEEEIMGRTEDA